MWGHRAAVTAGVWVERKRRPIRPLLAELMWRHLLSWRLAEARTRPCPGQGTPRGRSGQLGGDAERHLPGDGTVWKGVCGSDLLGLGSGNALGGCGDACQAAHPHQRPPQECPAQAGLCFGGSCLPGELGPEEPIA